MQRSLTFGAWLLGLAAGVASAQSPTAAGVVLVRVADPPGVEAEEPGAVAGLGFVAGDDRVIAAVDAARTRYVVFDAGGTEHEALLLGADEASGLGLLVVPGLTAPPYAFARDPVEEADEVHAAALDAAVGAAGLLPGRVLRVEPGSSASDPGVVRHDAFDGRQTNVGAPLLNHCGEVVGAVVGAFAATVASPGSGLAAPGPWLIERFTPAGLTAATVDVPCLSDAERAAAAEAVAAEARRRAAEAQRRAAAEEERRRRAEAEAEAEGERREEAESAAAAAQADADEEAEARRAAEERASAVQERAAADRALYVRWIAGGAIGVLVAGLLLWLARRRSVSRARQEQVRAESLAQAVREDLAERDGRERLASAVPGVFLDGADADGRPISVRVPGRAIAGDAGAVVGRNPFESSVVLDHTEVSRRHFRLSARETSLLVEDLSSTNGTTLDGTALTSGVTAPLCNGAVLQVGTVRLTVTLDAEGDGGADAPATDVQKRPVEGGKP